MQVPIITLSRLKSSIFLSRCGKLDGKRAKVLILLVDKGVIFNFSTYPTCGKVEKMPSNYTFVKNEMVENNKFSKIILTKIIQQRGEYSPVNNFILEHFAQNSAHS